MLMLSDFASDIWSTIFKGTKTEKSTLKEARLNVSDVSQGVCYHLEQQVWRFQQN